MKASGTNAQPATVPWFERRGVLLACLGLILAVAAWFRMASLGLAAYRSDEIVFYNICSQSIAPMEIVRRWMELMGITGQFPFPMAFTKWFIIVFNQPATGLALRLPSALWGLAAVAAAYGLGANLHRKSTGLMLAALLALNPMHIQVCREAYYYSPLVTGAVLLWWATLWALDVLAGRRAVSVSFYLLLASGFFLVAYSQPTGWPIAMVLLLAIVGSLAWRAKKDAAGVRALVVSVLICIVIGVPLLTSDWALKHLIQNASGATKAAALKALAAGEGNMLTMIPRTLTSFAWGDTAPRVVFLVVFLLAGLGYLAIEGRRDRRFWLLPAAILVAFGLYLFSRGTSGAAFESRYIVGLLPPYLLVIALGMQAVRPVLAAAKAPERLAAAGPGLALAAGLALNVPPSLWCTQLTGYPTPYYKIAEWFDANLPRGTPVIVDRWFEPWNELKVHPSTNVTFTFTIPNEPLETFLQTRWRDTVTNFFEKFPDAAYMEIAKQYWHVPGVGTWDWPRRHFARHVGITNSAGLKLREVGLANRGDFYWSTTNRVVVDIFYNTREDLIQRWASQGPGPRVLFGKGWGFTKTQDYRDWRLLNDRAEVEILNFGTQAIPAYIRVRGVAANAPKRVRIVQGVEHEFPAQRLEEWAIGPIQIPPGTNIFAMQDVLSPMAQTPLLVESVTVSAP